MTSTEAAALATRLSRVWQPEQELKLEQNSPNYWDFRAHLKADVFLSIQIKRDYTLFILYFEDALGRRRAVLGCRDSGDFQMRPNDKFAQFAAQWLPFFRRGVWLSGCAIDCTAHERLEWMQGFTEEELKTWNLKY